MPVIINSNNDLHDLEQKVTDAISVTVNKLKSDINNMDAACLFSSMKFSDYGRHPFENRPLNLIEQFNQTYTYLASLRATRWLLGKHFDLIFPLRLNLGIEAGSDIESTSADKLIAAETFACVKPASNDKLNKDIQKVSSTGAMHKYVFYLRPSHSVSERERNTEHGIVKIISLGWPTIINELIQHA